MTNKLPGLMATCVGILAAAAPSQQSAQLERVRLGHAHALGSLSDFCVEKRLLNDADRLLRRALELVPGEVSFERRKADLHKLWISVNKDRSRRDEYKKFWTSRGYAAASADLGRRENEIDADVIAKYLELASRAGDDTPELAMASYRAAYAIDPASRALRKQAGRARVEALRAERPGLDALQLGETVVGAPTDLRDLHQKVVLWRSVSL